MDFFSSVLFHFINGEVGDASDTRLAPPQPACFHASWQRTWSLFNYHLIIWPAAVKKKKICRHPSAPASSPHMFLFMYIFLFSFTFWYCWLWSSQFTRMMFPCRSGRRVCVQRSDVRQRTEMAGRLWLQLCLWEWNDWRVQVYWKVSNYSANVPLY